MSDDEYVHVMEEGALWTGHYWRQAKGMNDGQKDKIDEKTEQARVKMKFVRVEVIRRLWWFYNRGNSIRTHWEMYLWKGGWS